MKIVKICMLALIVCVTFSASSQGRLNSEAFYVQEWCDRFAGEVEVVLEDRTRVDCETYYHAIEFDFADKWAEAIGQALHYSIQTGKRAGIVLIVEQPEDMRYVERVHMIASRFSLPLDIWTTN